MFPVSAFLAAAGGIAFFSVFCDEEQQAVDKFATSLIKTFNDQIPPSCWEKKNNIQV